jgi:PAS domain S-box-containing protein
MFIIETDNLKIIDSNLSASALYGYSGTEFKTLSLISLLPNPGEFIRNRPERQGIFLLDDFINEVDHVSKSGYALSVISQSIKFSDEDESLRCIILSNNTDYFELKKTFSFRALLEEKIQSISSRFIGIESELLDSEINNSLKAIGEIMQADRSYLFLLSKDEKYFTNTHEWCAEGISSQSQSLQNLPKNEYEWFFNKLRENDYLYIPELGSLPSEAGNIRELLKAYEIKSLFAIPIIPEKKFIGFCGFDFIKQNIFWDKTTIKMLRSLGVIITNAIERKKKNEKNYLLRQALKHTCSGIVITDPNQPGNPIVFSNPAFENMTGYTYEELKGKNPKILQGPETDPASIAVLRNAIKERKTCRVILKNYRKDRTTFWNEIAVSPVFNSKGELLNFIGVKTDITERVNSENALRESENKLRSVIEQSANGVFITDEKGSYIEWNKKLEEITGLKKENVLTKKLWDVHLQISLPELRTNEGLLLREKIADDMLKDGITPWNNKFSEENLFNADGSIKKVETLLFPIKTTKGFIVAGIIHDLTDKKQNQEQINILSRAIESTSSAIVLADLNGSIVYVNRALLSLAKFTIQEEVIGRPIFEFTNSPGRLILQTEIIPSLLSGNVWKGDSQISTELNCSLISDEEKKPLYLLAVLSDITERKQMQEALITKEKMFRSVVESVKEVIFQTDEHGLWTYLNPAWEETTGFTVNESLGVLFLNYIHPDDRQRNAELFAPLIERKKEYCRHIVRYLTKSGGFRHIEVYARLTLDNENKIIGTSGTLNDVTERLKAEEDIRSSLSKEKELGELKSRFVSMVSHEFRTPLTSILASTELLLRYHAKWNDAKKLETTERVFRSAEYMNELVNDVLTLNRVESGKLSYNPEKMDLVAFCRNSIEEVRVLAKLSHKIDFSFEPKAITGIYDEKLLKHVVFNLFSNAIKYSPSGGTITIRLQKLKDKISLSVKDEGIGIPEEDQTRLFEPFFRGKNIANISGTGLGLSILKKAIEMHNGEINFRSEVNKGTEFTIILPVND